jgi:hypothetical protein
LGLKNVNCPKVAPLN